MIYGFSEFALDTESFALTRGSDPIPIEPQAFSLLQFLIENRERVVSKDDLIETVWGGRIVSDAALNSCVNGARRAVGDDGKSQEVIKTFPRRGFRFIAEIKDDALADKDASKPVPRRHDDKPSIAVLPFEFHSGHPDQAFFADALAEDLITGLSRIRWFRVVSRSSSFSYKGRSPNVREVAEELDVNYVVEGSVQMAGDRIRVSCRLVDCETGTQIWAERYDRRRDDLFEIQDDITRTIIGAAEPELSEAERNRASGVGTENLNAWAAYHQGMSIFWNSVISDPGMVQRAIDRFTVAISLDPNLSRAHSGLAYCHTMRVFFGLSENRDSDIAIAMAEAKHAVSLDIEDAWAHANLGAARISCGDVALAVPILETAIELNPSENQAYHFLFSALIYLGRYSEVLDRAEAALSVARRAPQRGPIMVRMAEANFGIGDYEKCVEWAQRSLMEPITQFWGNVSLTAGLSASGRIEQAETAAEELLRRRHNFTCETVRNHWIGRCGGRDFLDRYLKALRAAGIPEK